MLTELKAAIGPLHFAAYYYESVIELLSANLHTPLRSGEDTREQQESRLTERGKST